MGLIGLWGGSLGGVGRWSDGVVVVVVVVVVGLWMDG